MRGLVGYILGIILSIHTAITERSLKAGSEFWKGWRGTISYLHKDDMFRDTRKIRDDKIFNNSIDLINELERKKRGQENE